jgi:hypothetical protein
MIYLLGERIKNVVERIQSARRIPCGRINKAPHHSVFDGEGEEQEFVKQ